MRKIIVLLVACAFLAAFTVPARAADWSFYGISMFRTFIEKDSKEHAGGNPGGVANSFDDTDLLWGREHDTEIGAVVDAGDIGGKFAYRPLEASPAANQAAGDFKELYGTWKFGAGTILIGKTLGPVNHFPSSQVMYDNMGLVGFGGILSYFKPMIQLSFDGDWGSLKLAALEPETANAVQSSRMVPITNNSTSSAVNAIFTDDDTNLPKLEGSYTYNFGPVSLTGLAGWQEYDATRIVGTTEREYSVDSWIVGFGFKSSFGPAYLNGNIMTGQNTGNYQMTFQQTTCGAVYDATRDAIIDNDTDGFTVAGGINISEMFAIEVGYGWLSSELDMHSGYVGPNAMEDDLASYYIQARINVAKGFTIIPEIGKVDEKENYITSNGARTVASDQGDTVYYGMQWKITF